jgi:hypothetical protein
MKKPPNGDRRGQNVRIGSGAFPVITCHRNFDGLYVAAVASHLSGGDGCQQALIENVLTATRTGLETVAGARCHSHSDLLTVVVDPKLF